MGEFKLRSISKRENYATYLGLPLLELGKNSFGADNFMNAYFTVNGNIAALVRDRDEVPWSFWEHKYYNTDLPYYDGILILFNCPKHFEHDVINILDSKYSQLSEAAINMIADYSTMHIDFPNGDTLYTSRLFSQAVRRDSGYKNLIEKRLGLELPAGAELEPPLREQDILYDVDTNTDLIILQLEGGK